MLFIAFPNSGVLGLRHERIGLLPRHRGEAAAFLSAKAAGMLNVFLRRCPWGLIHARRPQAAQADIQISSLAELLRALENRPSRPLAAKSR